MPTRKARRVSARDGVDTSESAATRAAAKARATAENRRFGAPLPDLAMPKNTSGFKEILCHCRIRVTSSMPLTFRLVAQRSRHPEADFRPPFAHHLPAALGRPQVLGLVRPGAAADHATAAIAGGPRRAVVGQAGETGVPAILD